MAIETRGRPKKTAGILSKVFALLPITNEDDKELCVIASDFIEKYLPPKFLVGLIVLYLVVKYLIFPFLKKRKNKNQEVKENVEEN